MLYKTISWFLHKAKKMNEIEVDITKCNPGLMITNGRQVEHTQKMTTNTC